ncbi:hypothetical protein CMI46_02070 [Candidatus Pacearchaeota archaeon]|nr:hypothetical protein [Candidatus Pacearchaeota archaeon]|tara:strand:+ start:12612 stop:13229 length:618 start_codon:yes stop_codon:yes gene_type:complete
MAKMKFYVLWIALGLIIVFLLQTFFDIVTDVFILSEVSWTQPWRFVSAVFLHGSFAHLLSNLFALVFFGIILEKLVGSKKFLGIFLISGILANVVAINFYPNSLGASGAIMGIIGALAIIRPLMMVWAFGMILPMAVAAVFWILIDAIGIFIPDNVGNIAHLSGVFFGVVFGIIFRYNNSSKRKKHIVEVPEHILRRWETLYMRS